MPVFEYTALNTKGKTITGIIDADSAVAARQKLRATKTYPVNVKELLDAPAKKESRGFTLPALFTRVRQKDVTMMTRQLATLVGAGFPLVTALDSLIPQIKSYTFNKVLARIKDSIVEGNSFAGALSHYPDTFSPLYINMIRAGESSGTLEIVLEQLADISEKQQELKNRIQAALAYPVLMTLLGGTVLVFLLVFIVPNITGIFSDMDQVLPTPTRILIAISDFLKLYWWVILLILTGLVITARRLRKTVRGRYFSDKAILRLPLTGQLAIKLAIARFSRTLGSLLENGVTMLPALDIAKNIANNVLIAKAVEEAAKEVGEGQGLGTSLATTGMFPDLSIQMIQVGEQSARLEAMLNKMADVFENEAESSIMSLTSLLSPILILIMGIVVGFIVLSICLPIFEMSQLIK